MRRQLLSSSTDVVRYYDEMTEAYARYGGGALALHTGLRASETESKEDALLRSNAILVEGLGLKPGARILDAGCGLGGLAIHLALSHGVDAVGVTLCPRHVELATRHARNRGVGDRVRFIHMDYMNLTFPDGHFDAVLSQDAFCYAPDIPAYFAGIRRVLKQGGAWRAIDAFRAESSSSLEATRLEEIICAGWKTPVFPHWLDVLEALKEGGFGRLISRNLSPLAVPAAQDFLREKLLGDLAAEVEQEAVAEAGRTFREHMAACAAFGAGILDGSLNYMLLGGIKI